VWNSKSAPHIASCTLQQVDPVRIAREGELDCVIGIIAVAMTIDEPLQRADEAHLSTVIDFVTSLPFTMTSLSLASNVVLPSDSSCRMIIRFWHQADQGG
jgi:hypothetical protein